MQIYNSMTRKKEPFVPLHEGKVGIYACGPTVYNFFHIGNARPFIVFDVLRRYLEYRGYEVTFVQNFTDVDDKIIKRANDEGVSSTEIAETYIKAYHEDMDRLGVIRADIDTIIGQAYTYDSFLMLLRKNGYEVRRSPNRKYTTVKPPGAKRAIRLDSLGEGYTEADIMARLSRQRHGGMAPPTVTHAVKRYRMKGKLATVRKKKITGFHALYLRYLYLLRGGRRKKLPPKLPFSVKREVIHLERYEQQFKYLLSSGITTEAELEQRIRVLEWDIRLLEEQRKPLYQERRNTNDEEAQAKYSAEIEQQTATLREKRGELRLCRRMQSDIPRVSQQCQQAQAERQENLKKKEEHEHEYQR